MCVQCVCVYGGVEGCRGKGSGFGSWLRTWQGGGWRMPWGQRSRAQAKVKAQTPGWQQLGPALPQAQGTLDPPTPKLGSERAAS